MIAPSHLLAKFVTGKNHRVDFAHQLLLRGRQSSNRLAKTHISNDHDVDVAPRIEGAFGQRTKQECRLDTVFEKRQCSRQDTGHPHGFQNQSLEIGKDRTLLVGLKIDLAALNLSLKHSRLAEVSELSLGRPETNRSQADDLP